MGLSIPQIHQATLRLIQQRPLPAQHLRVLDIGCGHGELATRLLDFLNGQSKQVEMHGCDYTDHLLKNPQIQLKVADLNTEPLPYEDGFFDLITMTEVVEHIENHRAVMREMLRVLKPGGFVVMSTPNVLSIKSRIRNLFFGFAQLFGPMHMRESRMYSTGGHINPISLFYLLHSLGDAGFQQFAWTIDKRQRSAWLPLLFLKVPIMLYSWRARHLERSKYKTMDAANEPFVRAMNETDTLLGRTILVSAQKPSAT